MIPASRGFCITLRKTLAIFRDVLIKESILQKLSNLQSCTRETVNNSIQEHQKITATIENKESEHDISRSSVQADSKSLSNGNLRKDLISSSSAIPPSERKINSSERNTS